MRVPTRPIYPNRASWVKPSISVLKKYQINVHAIRSGCIQPDLTRSLLEDESFDKWLRWKIPQARWDNPEDLDNTAV
jgi:hypothetical protein